MKRLLSQVPSINKILLNDKIKSALEKYPEIFVKDIIKKEIDLLRFNILKGYVLEVPSIDLLINNLLDNLEKESKHSLRRVINATGTILHTNLGRSLLSNSVKENLLDVAFNYSNLEFNIDKKSRGSRYDHLTKIIKQLTGAEAVLVVNNNAAAVMLTLNTLANEKEIIVSRGELVEIGGAFRIPEIIKLSGGIPKEVGTTNKTHLADYKKEINENTAALLKVHTSNYKILGFTKEVGNEEIANLAKENNLISINDLGSGQLVDFRKYGLPYEPTVKEVLDSGIDVVTFSGDKLLGGPQAGIIVGKKKYIDEMKKNQLTRALRVDKMTIAALEATLNIYLDEERALEEIPTLHMISISKARLEAKAKIFSEKVSTLNFDVDIIEDKAEVGGGSYPASYLDSVAVKLTHDNKLATELEKSLLLDVDVPVITRIKDNSIILDMRTLRTSEFDTVINNLKIALSVK
ncbi:MULTISPECIES: L-seryl-tRNA(Sec) selenium transferase [unclassified Gemella]|uniref:L-seryl-tRNA(Sec) selenium transferase n=1 Tax=unclassified Gemella TaxID=2624949 RepID=UPI001C54F8F7|nr:MULTISPECIES: L-seryl-tRNA(Sec) selenium transferase [unclassified Gemella]